MGDWRITWKEHTWVDDDVTVADACEIAQLCGDGWRSLDPLSSPVHLTMVVAVLAARDMKRPIGDVLVELQSMKVADLAAMIEAPEG